MRLVDLGSQAMEVMEELVREGVSRESFVTMGMVAKKAMDACVVEEKDNEKLKEMFNVRCKWWNRGFCKEREKCSYDHPDDDCPDHLQDGGCSNKKCRLRHRKDCRYFGTSQGCHRGEQCQYFHKILSMDNSEVKADSDKGNITESQNNLNSENKETEKKAETCLCKKSFDESQVHVMENKIVCLLKRANCTEEEWLNIEQVVKDQNNDFEEMLEELSKVVEGHIRLGNKEEAYEDLNGNV